MLAAYVFCILPCIHQKAAVTVTTGMMAALANTVDDIDNVMKWQHDKLCVSEHEVGRHAGQACFACRV